MSTTTPQVYLGLRTIHPDLLPLLLRLKLSIVCLTKEASSFLRESELPHISVLKPTASTVIHPQDVLIANLVPSRVDVFLHSLIRSCCEKRCFVLTKYEDYTGFALGDELARNKLISKAFDYCAGFDALLARTSLELKQESSKEKEASFLFEQVKEEEEEDNPMHKALKQCLSSSDQSTSVDDPSKSASSSFSAAAVSEALSSYVIGTSKQADIGPSTDALSVAMRVAPDEDVDDERWDVAYLFFSDGERVVPNSPETAVCCFKQSDEASTTEEEEQRTSAVRAAIRIVDACVFSDAPYKGVVVLKLSKRGRCVGLIASYEKEFPFLPILSTVKNLKGLMEACATGSLGYYTDVVSADATIHKRKVRIAALGSTLGGSSLQPIVDEIARPGSRLGELCEIVFVLSDKENAGVLKRAQASRISGLFVSPKGKSRTDFDARVSDELKRRGVDVIVLVGYMRILSNEFCSSWRGRILNVHPSLLPDFAGGMDLQVHQAVLQAGKTETGCTVHLVTEVVDGGPVVMQKRCDVRLGEDTPETLKVRVQALEGPCLVESLVQFALGEGVFAQKKERLTYESAGVSTARGDELVERIKNLCKSTRRPGCDPDLGGFGACFNLHSLGFKDPILVSGTDGVGTKLVLAQELKEEKTVGIDLVAMSVNDLIVQGAEPMFFLDYFACGKLDIGQGARVISGIARGCELSGCALIGGETAEMPGMYAPGTYDLAGFAFGVVEREKLLPKQVREGDVLIGLRSSGIHSNGYSLVRKILKSVDLSAAPPFQSTRSSLQEIVMEPTRIYYRALKRVLQLDLVQALSHITGSGLPGNLPRVFDESTLSAEVDLSSWTMPGIFQFLAKKGPVSLEEMLSTFNCGIGMVVFVRPEDVDRVLELLPLDEGAFVMGRMIKKTSKEDSSVVFIGQSAGVESSSTAGTITYSSAGVDIHAGDSFVDEIKPLCKNTRRSGCMNLELGGFGSLFDLKEMTSRFKEPVIVSGTDGVGTKLLLAQECKIHNTVGIDLVAMSVNDLIVQGAEPVFFLDYLACGKLDIARSVQVVEGIARGCLESECALVGGETAEMPGMYSEEEYDLAGFAVGVVDKADLLPRQSQEGDFLIGMRSSGLHSNGFSLVRRILSKSGRTLEEMWGDKTVGETLLTPTKIYWKALKPLLHSKLIHGMAHITGSGIDGNLPRVFDDKTLYAEVDLSAWRPSEVFQWLQREGNVDTREMLATFNCGLGMILLCRGRDQADKVVEMLGPDECAGIVGTLKSKATESDASVVFVNETGFF